MTWSISCRKHCGNNEWTGHKYEASTLKLVMALLYRDFAIYDRVTINKKKNK